ncbi:MAG: GNAT family N-acetyltransferase [Myxococcales bacterium]|nr:GNAT family N-acetyltransferase [Myxococcales bacterium]
MAAPHIELRFVAPDDALIAAERQLRFRVLRDPLGLGEQDVLFAFEDRSLHLLALGQIAAESAEPEVIGCVLFFAESQGAGKLYQMAVDLPHQRHGLGRRMIAHLEGRLRSDGVGRIYLNARETALGFYEKLGYRAEGEPFIEVGIPHQRMVKLLK